MRRTVAGVLATVLATELLAGCGDDDDERGGPAAGPPANDVPLTKVAITAIDYGFDAPATIAGGTVELSFTNRGREAHFAGVAKVAPGRTLDDVRAALTAPLSPTPPPGPPPGVRGTADDRPGWHRYGDPQPALTRLYRGIVEAIVAGP